MRTTPLLLSVTVAVAVVAIGACCGKKTESTTEGADAAPATADSAPTEAPAEINPEWKTKCPQADRPAGGTVTALKDLTIHKEPVEGSEHIGSIGPGTWVNLLGVKQSWYCIDYPCAVGKLCPGWVEDRYTQRKTVTVDAGVVDAAVAAEAAAPIADAGASDGNKLVNIKAADAAAPTTTGKTPPGGRPPPKKLPK